MGGTLRRGRGQVAAGLAVAGQRARARLLQYEGVDDVRLAPDAVAQLARHVGDRPADDYHHERHHVLEHNDEGQPRADDVPVPVAALIVVALFVIPVTGVAAHRLVVGGLDGPVLVEHGDVEVGERVVDVVVQRAVREVVHQPRDELRRERDYEAIGDDAELADRVEYAIPHADVRDALRHGPPVAREELARVQPHLQHVVDEREQRRQRERRHENGHEAVL